ncbi:hypothetical protein Misp01_52010 [Microtetraspora sp. NBRC 13810]|uniref:DUF5753 domain-containing protein n=1 Tax=Microtetraspora sp. NBRC 13810 TaxID=3030990 RepID=UPI0024A3DF42|nr:DUF5753 domain-containing protein [Microtetraspora sp. NBRC 13810]GLW10072.1 hypothetical protein Misp01_52010 [Microtetraspora sp. NBRC 13810]
MRNDPVAREIASAARVRSAGWLAVFSAAMIPALLQTPEYARPALALGREVTGREAAQAATVRTGAQAMLTEPGRKFAFLLTEGAVRTWPGSPALMPAQLDRLLQVAELPNVRLGVVPWSAPVPAFPLHGFTIYDGTVSVAESFTGDVTLSGEAELAAHEEIFESFAAAAVYGDDLRILLARIRTEFARLPA